MSIYHWMTMGLFLMAPFVLIGVAVYFGVRAAQPSQKPSDEP